MQKTEALKNIIGGRHGLTENCWALSLVRRPNKEHAYLILESLIEDSNSPSGFTRKTEEAHLGWKEGSRNTKAEIIFMETPAEKLKKIGDKCHSITWSITKDQAEAFRVLVQMEQQRAKEGGIQYVMLGKSKVSGILGASLEASGAAEASTETVQASRMRIDQAIDNLPEDGRGRMKLMVKYYSTEFLDMLIREGHNCVSWAVMVVQSLKIPYDPGKFTTLVIVNPNKLVKGTIDGDEEPTSFSRFGRK